MTLITSLSRRDIDIPVLIGDLLITGPMEQQREQSIGLPTVGDSGEVFGDSGWGITGIKQKLVILSDTCIAAWAGLYVNARAVLAEIKALDQITEAGIDRVLDDNKDLLDGLTLIFHFTENDKLVIVGWSAVSDDDGEVRIVAGGTGSDMALEMGKICLKEMQTIQREGKENAGNWIYSIAATYVGVMLQAEFRSGAAADSLLHMFGGGYEIAFPSGGKFEKLGNITYCIGTVNYDSDAKDLDGRYPQYVVRQEYSGGYLLLRVADLKFNGSNFEIKREQCHIVGPMFPTTDKPNEEVLRNLSLQATNMVHIFSVFIDNEFYGIKSAVMSYKNEEDHMLIFSADGIWVNARRLSDMFDSIKMDIQRRALYI